MKVIATYNIKGGVGKTATAVNLARLAAREGAPTLILDLDPQGAASYYFRIKPKIKGGGKKLIQGKRNLERSIRGTDFELLDLLPADFSYRNMDIFLEGTKKPSHQLYKLLRQFKNEYEYVFLDCPPSISLVSENIFDATTAILVPTIPTTLSLRTYTQILQFFNKHDLDTNKLLPFFCMTDRRKKMHRTMMDSPAEYLKNLMPTAIPYDSKVEQMGPHRAPLVEFAPNARAARCYEALWNDVKSYTSQLK